MKLSLCIPTNGVVEWISQVIDSIYKQNVSEDRYEVVIVDNGKNEIFAEYIKKIQRQHSNIKYKRVESPIFMNEIMAYKMAEGDFIKFVNHRTCLLEGTLEKWISFMEENATCKPIIYFSNGVLDKSYMKHGYSTFDEFIFALGYWSSWSTGMAMWKEDIDKIDIKECNELFPHTGILFKNYRNREYIIDNEIYFGEVPHSSKKKGRYDLFYAFAVEYPALILDLYRNKDICTKTFLKLKDDVYDFIISLHEEFCEEKKECSYDLGGYEDNIRVFFDGYSMDKRKREKVETFEAVLRDRIEGYVNEGNTKIAVFGAGINGKRFVQEIGNERVFVFIDSDIKKQHTLRLGIPVVSLEEFLTLKYPVEIKICVGERFEDEVRDILSAHGLTVH